MFGAQMENRIESLTAQTKSDEEAIKELEAQEAELLASREQTVILIQQHFTIPALWLCGQKERAEKLQRLEDMKSELTALQAEIARHRDNDPEVIKELGMDTALCFLENPFIQLYQSPWLFTWLEQRTK